jgi:glutaredoxin
MRGAIIPLVALLTFSMGHAGEVYRWVDDDGTVHFSEHPPDDADLDAESRELNPEDVNTAESIDVERVESRVESGDEADNAEVVMYSASWCPICDKARAYFESNGIPFQEYDVEQSKKGKRVYQRMDVSGVPVIIVGDRRMVGFSPEGFERLYDA